MKSMKKLFFPIFTLMVLTSGCTTLASQPSVAVAMEEPVKPFQQGIELAKPTYTPIPTATLVPTITPTATIPPTPATFADEAFVVIEDIAPPVSSGYDNTTPYDDQETYYGSKRILVDISEQHMYVYEGDMLVYSFIASTGMGNSTRVGTFSVLNKIPNAYGATWNIWMPNWLGIYWSGSLQNGIHALPILPGGGILWAGYLGTPISYGCVVLGTYDAQTLYNWVDVGTPVIIQW